MSRQDDLELFEATGLFDFVILPSNTSILYVSFGEYEIYYSKTLSMEQLCYIRDVNGTLASTVFPERSLSIVSFDDILNSRTVSNEIKTFLLFNLDLFPLREDDEE